jgi:hypothetical protein
MDEIKNHPRKSPRSISSYPSSHKPFVLKCFRVLHIILGDISTQKRVILFIERVLKKLFTNETLS